MKNLFLSNPEIYSLIILPLLVFLAKILDVTLGTLRIIFVSKGYKYIAPVVSFIEIIIWLMAVAQIFQNLKSPVYYIAYAGGFSAGTFIGIIIEDKLSIGVEVIRIITKKEAEELIKILILEGYDPTISYAESSGGQGVSVIYMVIDRHDIADVVEMVKRNNPKAFYSVGEVKFVSNKILSRRLLNHKKYRNNLVDP